MLKISCAYFTWSKTFIFLCAGTHSEGGIWSVLFGLLMWDVLFMDVPEVFRTPFQSAPLDLGGAAFCSARQPLMDERLSAIECARSFRMMNMGLGGRGVESTCLGGAA